MRFDKAVAVAVAVGLDTATATLSGEREGKHMRQIWVVLSHAPYNEYVEVANVFENKADAEQFANDANERLTNEHVAYFDVVATLLHDQPVTV